MMNKLYYCVVFMLVKDACSLKMAVDIPSDSDATRISSCVEDYSSKLNSAQDGLGDHIKKRYQNFDFAGVRPDAYGNQNIFGVGFGTTATRSLAYALYQLGLTGAHFGPRDASLAATMGLNL